MKNNYDKFTFIGNGGDLFFIYVKNIFFSIITLGIYIFWARVNVTRFLYNHSRYLDEPFDYHATGRERFIGFLKAAGIIIVFYLLIYGMTYILNLFIDRRIVSYIIPGIVYAAIIAVIPFILVGRERFRQSRSSWKAVRFRFTGTPGLIAKIFLKGLFLSFITVGIYLPWFYCDLNRYFITRSHFGNQAFDFHGTGKMLAKPFFIGILLAVITLGIYFFWWGAALKRFVWDNTSIQGKRFTTTITGGQILATTLLSALLIIFTLGIGFPWAVIMNIRMYVTNMGLEPGVDFAAIKSDFDAKASALSDGLSEAADALDSIGGMLP